MSTPTPARKQTRGPADPVKALMHRHRELCERAVDPLEIAAGLEAHGVTDRTAARFRHRDVFSLAEELYARVPHTGDAAAPDPVTPQPEPHAPLYGLLPGAATAAAAAGVHFTDGQARLGVIAAGVVAVSLAMGFTLRRGPLRASGRIVPATRLYVLWLLAYTVYGPTLLDQLISGGPDGPWPMTSGPLLALALAVAPGAWCARLFSTRARRKLATSRGTDEFAAHARPLLLLTTALHLAVLTGLLLLTQSLTPVNLALGAALHLARLLTVHGFPDGPAAALAAVCAAQVLAAAAVLTSRLPGCEFIGTGAAALPVVAVTAAALALLAHAATALTRASAHTHT
ncbi:hypothetical protein [Streptomyces sp. NBC_01465]|uniref:hypothetical protein n=1 Tax=Streptomyces sp. NBC_01465 TaxID=2903878 RepID=UPI002E374232|nr:hypothetical protein [Streptomyces sp. NBC_01465]